MYSKNIQNFLKLLVDSEGNLHLNFEDDLVKGACIVHEGKISNPRIETLINEIKV
jgi:NAD(P) transhydrogenase subunit alpha